MQYDALSLLVQDSIIERPWDINGTGLDVWSVVSHGMKVAAMPRIWADIQIPRRRHDEDRGLDRLDIYRS